MRNGCKAFFKKMEMEISPQGFPYINSGWIFHAHPTWKLFCHLSYSNSFADKMAAGIQFGSRDGWMGTWIVTHWNLSFMHNNVSPLNFRLETRSGKTKKVDLGTESPKISWLKTNGWFRIHWQPINFMPWQPKDSNNMWWDWLPVPQPISTVGKW